MNVAESLLAIEQAKKYSDENAWLKVTLPPLTTIDIHLEASSTYLIIFGGGTNFKEISVVFTGTDGTPSHLEVFNATGYQLTTDTAYHLKIYSTATAAYRYCYVFNLAKTAAPYIVN